MSTTLTSSLSLGTQIGTGPNVVAGGSSVTISLTNDQMQHAVVATSTTAAALSLGSVSSPGPAYFKNLDGTDSIDVGTGTGGSFVPLVTLKPGEEWVFRLTATAVPTVKASANTPKLEYKIHSAT